MLAAGDPDGALAEFERLLAETGDPALHIDAARALAALGRHVEALERYERYLSEAGPNAPQADRQAADDGIAVESGRIGRIDVVADVEGAEVRLDGRQVGWTPLSMPLRVDPGRHVVELFHPRYRDERFELDVAPGSTELIHVAMQLPPPPPPRPSRAERMAREEEERWNAGAWNPVPRLLPWGWASTVPAGFMASGGVGTGDVTAAWALRQVEGDGDIVHLVTSGLTIPAFVGYRAAAAPMFAGGIYLTWQFHETTVRTPDQLGSEAYSMHSGAAARFYAPLGLLEPFLGFGLGYARLHYEYRRRRVSQDDEEITFQGLSFPLTVGLDVAPLSFLTAGFSFTWAFTAWLEECHAKGPGAPPANSRGCYDPGEFNEPDTGQRETVPDAWWFDFHVTFYLRCPSFWAC